MPRMTDLLIAGAASLIISNAFAECNPPGQIRIPDGSTATSEEMVNGQKQVKAYMAEMEAYLQCMDDESAALGDAETDEQKRIHIEKHNAAVEEMEAIAASFNEQVRAYKAVQD